MPLPVATSWVLPQRLRGEHKGLAAQSKASLKSSSAKRIAAKMLKWVVWQLIDEEPSSTLDTPSRDHFSFSGSQKTQTAWRSSPLSERTIGSCSACLSGLPEESKSERLKGTAARSVSFCEAPAPAADNSLVISELSGPAVKATTPTPTAAAQLGEQRRFRTLLCEA